MSVFDTEFLSGTTVKWLHTANREHAANKRRYTPEPDPHDQNQPCITVALVKELPEGFNIPTEATGKMGTYKVFTFVSGPIVFA